MTEYIATIRHHSISRAREIKISGTLTQAKAAAAREFSGEQQDYEIAVFEVPGDRAPLIAATRRVGAFIWRNH